MTHELRSVMLTQCKKGVLLTVSGIWPEEFNYLHISMYFTTIKRVCPLFNAGVDRLIDGGIWEPQTAGRSEREPSGLLVKCVLLTRTHLKTTEHKIDKLWCKVYIFTIYFKVMQGKTYLGLWRKLWQSTEELFHNWWTSSWILKIKIPANPGAGD